MKRTEVRITSHINYSQFNRIFLTYFLVDEKIKMAFKKKKKIRPISINDLEYCEPTVIQ